MPLLSRFSLPSSLAHCLLPNCAALPGSPRSPATSFNTHSSHSHTFPVPDSSSIPLWVFCPHLFYCCASPAACLAAFSLTCSSACLLPVSVQHLAHRHAICLLHRCVLTTLPAATAGSPFLLPAHPASALCLDHTILPSAVSHNLTAFLTYLPAHTLFPPACHLPPCPLPHCTHLGFYAHTLCAPTFHLTTLPTPPHPHRPTFCPHPDACHCLPTPSGLPPAVLPPGAACYTAFLWSPIPCFYLPDTHAHRCHEPTLISCPTPPPVHTPAHTPHGPQPPATCPTLDRPNHHHRLDTTTPHTPAHPHLATAPATNCHPTLALGFSGSSTTSCLPTYLPTPPTGLPHPFLPTPATFLGFAPVPPSWVVLCCCQLLACAVPSLPSLPFLSLLSPRAACINYLRFPAGSPPPLFPASSMPS